MRKKHKKSSKEPNNLNNVLLATAILNLIAAILSMIEKLLK